MSLVGRQGGGGGGQFLSGGGRTARAEWRWETALEAAITPNVKWLLR